LFALWILWTVRGLLRERLSASFRRLLQSPTIVVFGSIQRFQFCLFKCFIFFSKHHVKHESELLESIFKLNIKFDIQLFFKRILKFYFSNG
jgi:hypothetical protein